MDDFDLGDMLSPPMRYCAEEMGGASGGESAPGAAAAMVLGMSYVPVQAWGGLYEPEEGFASGTIFKGLDLPFEGRAQG